MGFRRLTLANVQLTGRTWEEVSPELQRFLEALNDTQDEGVIPAGNYVGIPATLDVGSVGLQGDPLDGWSSGLHEHPIPTGVPAPLGVAEAEGTGNEFARLGHVHARAILGRLNDADVGVEGAFNLIDTATINWGLTDDAGNGELEITADVDASGISHGDLADLGPPADDHPQYLHLPGRAGGQQAFGGTGSLEELQLRGTTNANLGFIRMQAPVIFDGYTANPTAAYAFDYNAAEGTVGAFVGGGLNMSGSITSGAATFIYESFRGAPSITTGANPGFAAYTVLQALPLLSAGAGGGHNPLSPLIVNAGATVENEFASVRTVNSVVGVNFSSRLKSNTNGATLNCSRWVGLVVAPTWNVIGGATVSFGNIIGVDVAAPAVGLFGQNGGAKRMSAFYGMQVANPTINNGFGTAPCAAIRSVISAGTNRYFLLNAGTAPSDHGAAHMYFDDNFGVVFGGNGITNFDAWTVWHAASNALRTSFATFFDGILQSGPSADRFLWEGTGGNSVTEFNFNVARFSLGAQSSPVGNQVGVFVTPTRSTGVAGDWADFLLTHSGNLTINHAMGLVAAWVINASSAVLGGGGSVVDGAALVVGGTPPSVATNRYGVLIRSAPTGSGEAWSLRTLGSARIDTLFRFDEALNANQTTVTGTTHTAGDEFAILVDDDTAGSAVTVTLPPSIDGRVYNIKKLGTTANVVIDGDAAELIDGALTLPLVAQYETVTLIGDGTGWWVI